jgi:hypothetical protein
MNLSIQTPSYASLQERLQFDDYVAEKFLENLPLDQLKTGLDIKKAWERASSDFLSGLLPMARITFNISGTLHLNRDKFLCFYDDKELGSMAWTEIMAKLEKNGKQ